MKTKPRQTRPTRERKTPKQRREELLNVAVRVAQKEGVKNLTYRMLTGRYTVSRSLWFYYFPTLRVLRNAVTRAISGMATYKVGLSFTADVELDYVVGAKSKKDAKQMVLGWYRNGVPDFPIAGIRVANAQGTTITVNDEEEEDDDA
jgi:AcrR family transcriptional regulator